MWYLNIFYLDVLSNLFILDFAEIYTVSSRHFNGICIYEYKTTCTCKISATFIYFIFTLIISKGVVPQTFAVFIQYFVFTKLSTVVIYYLYVKIQFMNYQKSTASS